MHCITIKHISALFSTSWMRNISYNRIWKYSRIWW